METRKILLRSVCVSDFPTLFAWRNGEDYLALCTSRHSRISFEEFVGDLRRDLDRDSREQFIILRKRDGRPIGTVFAHNYNRPDGYAFVTVFVAAGFQGKGYAIDALWLCLRHLFRKPELYKIYFDVYDHNTASLRPLQRAGFQEEGRFKGHRCFAGKRWDMIRFAMYRHNLPQLEQRFAHL